MTSPRIPKQPEPAADPPRRRSRWALVLVLLLLVAFPVGHAFWRDHQWRKLQALIDRHRAQGEPVLPEDFNAANVDDPSNPAPQLIAAATAVPSSITSAESRQDPLGFQLPMTPAEVERLRPVLEQSATALDRARAAAELTGQAAWPVRLISPVVLVALRDLNAQRNLARLLRAVALDAHRRGDDAQAVERVHEILFQAHALYRYPTLIAHLVGVGIQSLGDSAAKEIAPDLEIATAPVGHHPATPEQARRLIRDLLDERPLRDGQRLALLSERMVEVDSAEAMADGKFDLTGATSPASKGRAFMGYVLSPLYYLDGQLLFERMTKALPIAQAPDWQACRTELKAIPDARASGSAHLLLRLLTPATGRLLNQDFRVMTDSRITATMLACWWYAAEHEGKLPQTLDQLVPRYLPAIPADPMAHDALLMHHPDTNDPLLYSTGEDGKDNGASTRPSDPSSRRQPSEWDLQDYVVHLKRQPRELADDADGQDAQPPATQPASTEPS